MGVGEDIDRLEVCSDGVGVPKESGDSKELVAYVYIDNWYCCVIPTFIIGCESSDGNHDLMCEDKELDHLSVWADSMGMRVILSFF